MGMPKQSHCAKGHRLEGDNLIVKDFGWRECRICANRRKREYYYVKSFCKRTGATISVTR